MASVVKTMQLFFNQTSPYARKVRVVAIEKGLVPQIEMHDLDPWSDPPALLAVSPLSKVPVLVTAQGVALTESDHIARFLDDLVPQPALMPQDASARAEASARMALSQGMIDAAFDSVIERRRPSDKQWPDWIARQHRAIERGLAVAATLNCSRERFDLGDIALAVLLGYLDYRLPSIAWREAHPALADWYDAVARREAMQATRPG
jgi:glutathione S-transferase